VPFAGVFENSGEIVEVLVSGNTLLFSDSSGQVTLLEGLKFDKQGVIREFQDLENDEEWKKKAIERLKEHIKKMNTEKETLDYVKDELVKFGNKALYYRQKGFRP
jgi:D-mannonate dehydratase